MQVNETAPIFRIFDEAVARRFSVEWLGFTVQFEHLQDPFGNRLTLCESSSS
ncbi:MAG TPA: glyoxalase superfamily protein [Myxococcota bacterium]